MLGFPHRRRTIGVGPTQLAARVVGWQVLFSVGTAAVLGSLAPFLLLLSGAVALHGIESTVIAVLAAGFVTVVYSWTLVHARRRILRALAVGAPGVDQLELPKLNDDPWRIVNFWVGSNVTALALSMSVWRPGILSPTTALTLCLLAWVMVAAAALPLLVLVRAAFVQAIELAPPDLMREIIEAHERSGKLRGRISRRLIIALVTPVVFLTVGSALIASAHLRSADEHDREETARAFGRAMLEAVPARGDDDGRNAAIAKAARLGFRAELGPARGDYAVERGRQGLVRLTAPLDTGSALVEFSGSTVTGLAWPPLLVAVCAVAVAGGIGVALGRYLSRDLRMANRGVRMLGTDAALEGTRVMRPARFRAVAELGNAIELLASRFRLFAQAQERAIDARQGATRMRGLFFASVSHDLKSPLNAILGFAELTERKEVLSSGQRESLGLIIQRGNELLALIETILDAARVEAGQLTLSRTEDSLEELVQLAIEKGKLLSAGSETVVLAEVAPNLPKLFVDRIRLSQALATFIGHARRTAERASLRIRVDAEEKDARPTLARRRVRVHIEIPSSRFSAAALEAMLSPEVQPGLHRGLALALRLAKSIVELHGGRVRVTGRTVREPAFAIELFTRPGG
jgi:signal transduction histidine kinase